MFSQEEGAVSRRRFRLALAATACASSLLVMGIQLVTPVHFRTEHAKRIAELESSQLGLYQALAGQDRLFQNERRNYVERIKKRDELLRQREQMITALRSRLGSEVERVEPAASSISSRPGVSESGGVGVRMAAPQIPGSIAGR
jgi:hypothetical protein